MGEGVAIDVAEIDPGTFTGLVIKPKNESVQTTTQFEVSYTTAHKLEHPAKMQIVMGDGLTLPPNTNNYQVLMVTD